MAQLIALCCMIALSILGVLQPIDCGRQFSIDELYEELDDKHLTVKGAENLLEEVSDKNKDKYAFGGISVRQLLSLRDMSNVDCRLEKLKEDDCDMSKYRRSGCFIKGLQTYCRYYSDKRVKACADELFDNFKTVEKQIDDADKGILKEFYAQIESKLEGNDKMPRDQRSLKRAVSDLSQLSAEEDKKKFKSSCKKLSRVLMRVDPIGIWPALDSLLEERNVSRVWHDIGEACTILGVSRNRNLQINSRKPMRSF